MLLMKAELLSIGSELTSGQTVNTNAAYLARRLREIGIDCPWQTAVADEQTLIIQSVREALRRSRLLLITGGLGPTFDDLTMAALAEAIGHRLVLVPAVARHIRAFCRRHQRSLTTLALRQAYLPQGASALPNPIGSAPGVWLALGLGETIVVALPGVPQEMRAITEASVLPRLRRRTRRAPIHSRTLRTVGVMELEIQRLLKTVPIPAGMALGLYPNLRAVDICLTMRGSSSPAARRALRTVERRLRARLGAAVYGLDEQALELVVGETLVAQHKTLAVAESCTGGLVSDRLTNVPGSSRYLLVSLVAYQNRAKQEWLGVPEGLLLRHGAVSAPVARAMAQGIRRCVGADVGLAITGIAGPGGGTPTKPVGLVYLAVADARGSVVERSRFHGDRVAIKGQAVQMALNLLRKRLLKRR